MAFKSSDGSVDFGKYIADELVARSELLFKLLNYCEKVALPQGMGKTANFTRFERTTIPVGPLSEGVTPDETPFSITQHSVQVDQFGLYLATTDVAPWTIKHPVLNEMLDLVADAIKRTREWNAAEVLNDGTNVQYWDGSRLTRAAITSTDYFATEVAQRAIVGLQRDGSPARQGDLYVAVCGPEVAGDIRTEAAAVGSWTAAKQVALEGKQRQLETGVIGEWQGFKWVMSNFLPRFTLLSIAGWTVAEDTNGGAIATNATIYYKITRKDLMRGFEEDISAEASIQVTNAGNNSAVDFTAPSTAGYVYNIYAGAATGDANLFLAKENLAASGAFKLTAIPTSGTVPPQTPPVGVTVHPVYIFAKRGCDSVELSGSSVEGMMTKPGAVDSDPLNQRRKVGSKYMAKEGIRDQLRVKRIELASRFSA